MSALAQARRLYLHALNDGRVTAEDMSRLIRLLEQPTEDEAWQDFLRAAHRWVSRHMDQWEMVKFETEFGTIYLTLSHKSDHPDAFEAVEVEHDKR